jgi:small basic protein
MFVVAYFINCTIAAGEICYVSQYIYDAVHLCKLFNMNVNIDYKSIASFRTALHYLLNTKGIFTTNSF